MPPPDGEEELAIDPVEVSQARARGNLSTAKRNHTRSANTVLKECNANEDIDYIKELVCSMKSKLEILNEKFSIYLEVHDSEDTGELDKNCDVHDAALKAYFKCRKLVEPKTAEPDTVKPIVSEQETSASKPRPKVILPDMSPFNNNIREYANFKSTFREKYEPYYGDLASVILKDKLLTDYSKDSCKSLETVDEIFTMLDKSYGDNGKLAEAVLADINKVKPCRKNSLIDLRTLLQTIQLAETDLRRVKLDQHIKQYHTVTVICDKLPPETRRRWAGQIARNKISTDDRYSKILEFLDLEIRTAELYTASSSTGAEEDTSQTEYRSHPPSKQARQARGQKPIPPSRSQNPQSATTSSTTDTRIERQCPLHPEQQSHGLARCFTFRRKRTEEKVKILEQNSQFCRSCLDIHDNNNCNREIRPCDKPNCGKRHFSVHHEACTILSSKDNRPHSYAAKITPNVELCNLSSVSPGQRIRIPNCKGAVGLINSLWDNGSNVSLILQSVCSRFGLSKLEENASTLDIETVGGSKYNVDAYLYEVPLFNTENKLAAKIRAYAVDKIGNDLNSVDMTEAFNIFGIPPADQGSMTYPNGELQMLIGADNAHLILHHVIELNGLRLSESALGKVIWGRHPSFSVSTTNSRAVVTRKSPKTLQSVKPTSVPEDMVPLLFSTDIMGVQCQPNCGGCACGKCTVDGDKMTHQERFEYNQIKESITLENKILTASYPYRRNLDSLDDNYDLALRRLTQLEQQLLKDPETANIYSGQISDMQKRGVLRKLSPQEIDEWKGVVQYLPHHLVYKPTSESTPARLVFDPSSKYKGKAVNEFWGRGPSLLNDLIGILLRFCENQTAIAGDISKMYNTVHTRPQEWHLHRVLWRDIEPSRDPDIYVIVRNSFGSGPAGTVAIAAKDYLAELKEQELPRAADTIKNQTFVDDVLESVQNPEQALKLTQEIDSILDLGSFKIKKWIIVNSPQSSQTVSDVLAPSGSVSHTMTDSEPVNEPVCIGSSDESILGIIWDTKTDEFRFRVKLNFSNKKKKIRQGPNLLPGEIFDKQLVPTLTRRLIMSQVYGLYDIPGLLTPFIVELKFSLGKLWRIRPELGWDMQIPDDHDARWRELFDLFFQVQKLRFSRCLSPRNPKGDPKLLVCSDSSMIAYSTVAYIWWECTDDSYFTHLIAAKSRMWPIHPDDWLSVERGELQGAVLSKRLSCTIQREMRFEFSEIIYIVDSEIVFSQINTDSHNFNVFVGHRVAEIRKSTELKQWWLVTSGDNPCADLASRGTTDVTLLSTDSVWQTGPPWLAEPRDTWPITQQVKNTRKLPELRCQDLQRRTLRLQARFYEDYAVPNAQKIDCKIYKIIQQLGETKFDNPSDSEPKLENFSADQRVFIASMFDLKRSDNLEMWLAVTFRVLHALSFLKDCELFRKLSKPDVVSADQRQTAMNFWIIDAQRTLTSKIKTGQLKTLTPFVDEQEVIRVNGRIPRDVGSYHPILLPHYHPLSRLIVVAAHRRGHGGAVATAARVRSQYHILQLRHLCTSVRNECHLCRVRENRLLTVPMANVPKTRVQPSFAFEHTACDLTGPFAVKIPGKTTRGRQYDDAWYKAYVLILNCLSTRAVHLEVMQGMNTSAFLMAFRRFVTIRGQPKSIWSDNGGQIVSADKELQSFVKDFSTEDLQRYGAKNGTKFEFCSPGSPWQNGVSEALIKSVKITLRKITTPNQRLPILELQTIMYEIAELLNERPISLGHQGASGSDFDAEMNTYVCPNQLLLGRSTVRVPAGPFLSVPLSHENRLLANQTIVTNWWKNFTELALPQLIRHPKWYKSSRHVKIGDIVHVKDLNPIRGDWGIGEIIEIKDNSDGIPRNVLIRYKPCSETYGQKYNPSPHRTQWRDVKNLSMILTVEERSELNPNAPDFVPRKS